MAVAQAERVADSKPEERRGGAVQMVPEILAPSPATLARLPEEDQQLLKKVLSEPVEYVQDPLFDKSNAEVRLYGAKAQLRNPKSTDFQPIPPLPASDRVHAGVSALTAEQERAIFLRFNYARYRVFQLVEAYRGKRLPMPKVRHLLGWEHRALIGRSEIVRVNIPLVLAMAKRTRLSSVDFSELISEGNMALLRSVDKFDCSRGFKFSTYACRAILKSFSRVAMRASRYRGRFPTEFDPTLERSDFVDRKRDDHEHDCVDEVRSIISANRADLNEVEMTVIRERFALGVPESEGPSPKTLEQVGAIIGVTKERVRQIQNKALGKLREVLEGEFLAA